MKQLFTFFFLLCLVSLTAQTDISGVINTYTSVQNINVCPGIITVADATSFAVGDKVMIIQMKGASIDEDNDSSFGTVTDLGNTGLYEINTITNVSGNTISLGFALINTYDIAGIVQLVSVPVYESATVVGDIFPIPWDGTTGGIVALEVENSLVLNAGINADGAGFRGAATNIVNSDCSWLNNQDDYYYEAGDWRGSKKGEGIAAEINDKEWGRGAQANGGGGGNDHNAGGGGGGNVNAGGKGGNRSPDGAFSCDGDFPGEGGVGFSANSDRAFLGGGGGAGHTDNAGAGSAGGNGGGLIFVKTNTLTANGNTISADGLSNDTAGDGAGGGGAGGTIILSTNTTNGMPTISAEGGAGGNTVASSSACSGPGGGGGGGRILTNSPAGIDIQLTSGGAGINTGNLSQCSGASNGATDGAQGNLNIIAFVPEGAQELETLEITQQPVPTLMVCEGESFTMIVDVNGTNLNYQWQGDSGSGFGDLPPGGAYSGENTDALTINNALSTMTGWEFRVVVIDNCGEIMTSDVSVITVNSTPTADFSFVSTSQFTFQFTDNSTGSFSTSWDFGDMSGSGDTNPLHTFPGLGCYMVTQIVTSPCGSVTAQQEICISEFPTAAFSSNFTEGCATLNIQFQNESIGMPTSLEWQFPGGFPNMIIDDPQPIVMYPTAGIYDVILIATNSSGSDTITQTAFVEVTDSPTANFTFNSTGNSVMFSNQSMGADTYLWDFGDMGTSNEMNPNHTYATQGTYDVTLTVTNGCGSSSQTLEVVMNNIPTANFSSSQNTGCAPLVVQFNDTSTGNPTQWFWEFPGGTPATSNEQNPLISYTTPNTYNVSLVVTNAAGNNFYNQLGYVDVEAFPEPEFTFEIDLINPLQVNFINNTLGAVNLFVWDFGDGTTSNDLNPVHIYENGATTYTVTLNAVNGSCGAGASLAVPILFSDVKNPSILPLVNIYPSPFTDDLFVDFAEMPESPVELHLTSISGRTYRRQIIDNQQNMRFRTDNLPSGVYILQMIYAGEIFAVKVVK